MVSATSSTVGGGTNNNASGYAAAVPGGQNNVASGSYSFAAGNQAQATNQGAFVWRDPQPAPFVSTSTNQFSVRANGGMRVVTAGAGMTLDGQPVLAGTVPLSQLPSVVLTNGESGVTLNCNHWHFKWQRFNRNHCDNRE